MNAIQGIHHITAIARDPQQNVWFYQTVLGQRLVKQTVNFDDPGTYHLYYGDAVGSPGTIVTFFPWPHITQGTRGTGEAAAIAYRIPKHSIPFWEERIASFGLTASQSERFDETVLTLSDPDGIVIELIANEWEEPVVPWNNSEIPDEHMLQGFHSTTLWLENFQKTGELLTKHLGFTFLDQNENRYRYRGASSGAGLYIDLLEKPRESGRFGAGSIHHVAFRTVDDNEQRAYLAYLKMTGQQVTPVKDRQYFHSIYFREQGGVLLEIATDAPGFGFDESIENLGTALKLPPWLEERRTHIESVLPELNPKD